MKFLTIALPILFLANVSMAEEQFPLKSDDVAMVLLTQASVEEFPAPRCPNGALCDPAAGIRLNFMLGCLNQLGPVTYTHDYDEATGKTIFNVTAWMIVNKKSYTARCVRATTGHVDLIIGMGHLKKDQVEVRMTKNFVKGRTI